MVMQPPSAFSFRASGLVSLALLALLSALPSRARAAALFTDDTVKSLGIGAVQACADSGDPGCYTNWFELADIDADGDLDIVMANGGGLFGPGNLEAAVVYLNDSKGAFLNATSASFSAAYGQVRQVAVGDIDGDGDLDIYQPGAYGTDDDKLWVQTAPRTFTEQAATLLPPSTRSRAGATHLGDLDRDGDLDLVVADWGDASPSAVSRLILYSNDGHGRFKLTEVQKDAPTTSDHFPATIAATDAPYYGARPTDLDFVDVDGDFDLDILVNHREGFSRIFLNDGHGYFSDGTGFAATLPASIVANYAPKRGPYANNQEACDLDHDGDLDLVLDNTGKAQTDGNGTQILINDGRGVFSDQTATRIVGEPAAQDGAAKCADVNGDGYYDIVIGSRTHSSEKVLLNDGSGVFAYAADALPPFTDITLAIDLGDLNGDGKLDLVTGQGEGTITPANASTLRNNRVYYGLAADVTPPTFRAIETPIATVGTPIVFHVAISDSTTNQAGQMAALTVPYTIKGQTKQAKVSFVGGDLFRIVIPAQPDGTVVDYVLSAVDRAKLTTRVSKVLTVGTPPVVVAAAGAGGEGGSGEIGVGGEGGELSGPGNGGFGGESGGAAGEPNTDAGTEHAGSGGKPPGNAPTGGTSAGGTTNEGGEAASEPPALSPATGDDGCSCSMVPSNSGGELIGFGLALALLGRARRRRQC